MRKLLTFIWIFIITFSVIVYDTKAIDAPPTVSADGVVLMDKNTGQILYSKNLDSAYPPASTTKIMTALLALEKCKLDDVVTVGKNATDVDGSKIYIFEGEKLTIRDLLYSLLLQSANDCAVALAEHISGSTEEFVKLMNSRAKELGCKNTNFVNPHGLYDDKHKTSARDLALILKELSKHEDFKKIATTQIYTINPTNKEANKRFIWNKNKLVQKKSKSYYQGCEGGKTGYTVQSKHSFVATATRDNKSLIAVLLHDGKHTYWEDVVNLFNFGFNNYTKEKLYSKNQCLYNYKLDENSRIPILATEDFYYLRKKGESDIPELKVNKISLNNKSFKKGDVILTGDIVYKNQLLSTVNLSSGINYSSKKLILNKLTQTNFKNNKYLKLGAPIGIIILLGLAFLLKKIKK